LSTGGITVTNGTKGALTGSGNIYTLPVTPNGQGAITCTVNAAAAQDAAANGNSVSNTASVTYDTLAPTVAVTPNGTSTSTSPITFTLTFSEPVTGLTAGGITVSNGTKGALTGSGTTYTIPVTPTTQGAVTCTVNAGAAQDAATNPNTASNIASVTYNPAPPSVVVTPSGTTTKNSPITFTLTFSAPVTGLTASGITVTNGTKGTLTGSGAIYTIPVTPSAQGAVTCTVSPGAALDSFSNGNTVSNTASVTYDNVAPTVSVTPNGTTAKNSPITFTLTFSESVTGLTASGITVTNGTKGALTGSGTTYTIPVTPTAQGAVTCSVNAAAAQDAASNNNTASNTASITYDSVAPAVTVTPSSGTVTSVPINFTITFSEPVTGLTAGGITVGNGTKGTLTGSGTTYTMPVTPTAFGAVTCAVGVGVAQDAATNGNTASNTASVNLNPSCTISPTGTSANGTITFTLTFSEPVDKPNASANITVSGGNKGTLSGTAPSTVYTLPVTPSGSSGSTVTCLMKANAVSDNYGNKNTISNTASVTYDATAPTVTVSPTGTTTGSSPINFTLTFSEAVTGLTAAGITVTNGTKGALTGSGTTYTMPVTPTSAGAVTCTVNAGAAQDAATNNNTASNTASVTYNPSSPSVVVTPSGTTTKNSPITFTITFSTSVTGFTSSGITVTNGTKGTLSGSGTTYTIPVTPSAQGAVTCSVNANAAQDAALNYNTASNTASVTYDTVAPSVTVTPTGTSTSTSPITFTLTFSEPVTGLTAAGITVTNGTKGALTGSGTTFSIPVSATPGTVTCQVNASAAQDAATNNNTASNIASVTLLTAQQSWRLQYFGTTDNTGSAADTADPDGDGCNNLLEYVAGLDPTNPSSRFITNAQPVPGQPGQMSISFGPIVSGRTYVVKSASTLINPAWTALSSSSSSESGTTRTVTDLSAGPGAKFYHVEITAP
jgi:methionine-rich copper-binding protein CopC